MQWHAVMTVCSAESYGNIINLFWHPTENWIYWFSHAVCLLGKDFLGVSETMHKVSLHITYLHTKYLWEENSRLWKICFDNRMIYCIFSLDFILRISVIIPLSTDFAYLNMTDRLASLINENVQAWLYFLIITVRTYCQLRVWEMFWTTKPIFYAQCQT